MLKRLPGVLVAAQMILLTMLLSNPMGMGGVVMKLGRPLMVFIVGTVVIACGHMI
jgi:hypothetical protein